jgi:hypothetical protein
VGLANRIKTLVGQVKHETLAFDTAALSDAATVSEPAAFGQVRRLVPSSGIQFIDARIEAARLPMLRQWFVEDEFDAPSGKRRVLLPLTADNTSDGTVWHPVTFRPLGPTQTMSFSGLEGLEPFLDTWMPLPYLRYLGRGEGGARFDQGPSNWARVFVTAPARGLRGADHLDVVFAFDTKLDAAGRADQPNYLAPNTDDALFASTFMLADGAEQVSEFLSQPWVDSWIRQRCNLQPVAPVWGTGEDDTFDRARAAPQELFKLRHVAQYLTFLKILTAFAEPPQIRFVDSMVTTLPVGVMPIDLVIDFDATTTTAVLVPRTGGLGPDIAAACAKTVPLRMRDLTRPTTLHSGDIPTLIEFDHQTFGNAALSRRSGRTDAFAWTSLVRVGHEAKHLALRSNAVDGVTGLADLAGQIGNIATSDVIWRFSTTDGPASRASPMVTGDVLRHVQENGEVRVRPNLTAITGQGGVAGAEIESTPVLRPRFSQSSLVGFFTVEMLMHALSEINSVGPNNPFVRRFDDSNIIRRLDRVIVTSSLAMPAADRQMLVERVKMGIDLVWRSQGWDQPTALAAPPKPTLALGMGSDVGLQLVYLLDELRNKLGGTFTDLVDMVRRRSGDPDARDTLRIASVDLGRRALGLSVIDYDVLHDGAVRADVVLADRVERGGDSVIDAMIAQHIVPAIEQALARAGSPGAAKLFATAFANQLVPDEGDQLVLDRRLTTKVLMPAALALFELYTRRPQQGAEGLREFRLDRLVEAGGGRLDPVADEFDAACMAAGATNFKLANVAFLMGRRHLQAHFTTELSPALGAVTSAIKAANCDLVLLGGELAYVADLRNDVITRAPVPAARIVVLTGALQGTSDRGKPTGSIGSAAGDHIRLQSLVGAYLADRNELSDQGLDLITSAVSGRIAAETGMLTVGDVRPIPTAGTGQRSGTKQAAGDVVTRPRAARRSKGPVVVDSVDVTDVTDGADKPELIR